MASGKVAIGCERQGIEEVIRHRDNGWLVPPNGLEELIEGLRVLLENDLLRRQIGTAARNTVLQSFTLADQAQGLLKVYRESLA
jgi:glycosyltransferase involved in cell wall biosynthesis